MVAAAQDMPAIDLRKFGIGRHGAGCVFWSGSSDSFLNGNIPINAPPHGKCDSNFQQSLSHTVNSRC